MVSCVWSQERGQITVMLSLLLRPFFTFSSWISSSFPKPKMAFLFYSFYYDLHFYSSSFTEKNMISFFPLNVPMAYCLAVYVLYCYGWSRRRDEKLE